MSSPYGAEHRLQLTMAEEGPLGHMILGLSDYSESPLEYPYVINGIDDLKAQFRRLLGSRHPDDQAVVADLQSTFREHDSTHLPASPLIPNREVAATRIAAWIEQADPGDILTLLNWNRERYRQSANQLTTDWPMLLDTAETDFNQLIELNLLPRRLRPLFGTVLRHTVARPLDTFESSRFLCLGSHASNEQLVAIAARLQRDNSFLNNEVHEVVTHEVAGHGVDLALHGGFTSVMPGDDEQLTWFDEMYVSYLARVARTNKPDIIDPFTDHAWEGHYPSYQKLGHAILFFGDIDPTLLGEAFTEPLDSGALFARQTLQAKLRATLPRLRSPGCHTVVESIAKDLASVPYIYQGARIDVWLSKIRSEVQGAKN